MCSKPPWDENEDIVEAILQPTAVGFPLFSALLISRQSVPGCISGHSQQGFHHLLLSIPSISPSPDSLKITLRWKTLTPYSYRAEFNK